MARAFTKTYSRILKEPKISLYTSFLSIQIYKQCTVSGGFKVPPGQGISKPMSILYFGSDNFAIPSLQMLHSKRERGELADLAVVSVRLRAGRTAVRRYAEQNGLPVLDWPPQLAAGRFNLGVVASFGHLLPRRLIDLFPAGVINVHASLLPRWRGAAPVVHALLAGDRTTGVTIMVVKPHRFDVGDVLAQSTLPVAASADVHQLTEQLAERGAALLERCLDDLPASLRGARPQPKEGVTLAPRLTAADYRVEWTRPAALQGKPAMSGEEFYNGFLSGLDADQRCFDS
ncbi:methionyl-tRNA formyltransferase, mitochondrial-like [Pollicipes pollicipes]|uniref:methionyl-tRNA formyltransferase, mitochondrial-like n=1 Tax=Pollicipes pollicipes TaxID=41117 RepID=UPI0018852DA7|nr:methionyl-tRNA formyltransferase, mitochondrial-like [Pollicipes pollicipes]